MKQNVFLLKKGVNKAVFDYEAPSIQIEEVVVEQGYAGSAQTERDWIHGGELKDSYE